METAIETTYTAATPLELIAELRAALSTVMRVENHTIHEPPVGLIEFTGQLTCPSDQAFKHIYKSFIELGYTPMLTTRDGREVVVAQHGIVEATRSDPRINAVLLGLTIISTVFAGTLLYAETSALGRQLLSRASDPLEALLIILRNPQLWLIGLPYAAALLSILGVHEMGHYVAARRHKADVTLPYFIPMPIGLGTMGAVIRLKSPIKNRRQLFDIGVAGPLAGLAVAVPLLIIGLATSPVVFIGRPLPGAQEGNSILYLLLKLITKGQILPGGGYDVSINAIAFRGLVRPDRHDDQSAPHRPARRRAHHLLAVRARTVEDCHRRASAAVVGRPVFSLHDERVLECVAVVGDSGAGVWAAPSAAAG